MRPATALAADTEGTTVDDGPPAFDDLRGEWSEAQPRPRSRRSHVLFRGAMALVGLTVAIAVAVAALPRIRSLSIFQKHQSFPAAWDSRVVKLAQFVEQQRGLRFKHPVAIDFLTPEQYTAATTTPPAKVTATERKDLDRVAGALRAVGLVGGKLDLASIGNQLEDSGTLASYDFVTKRVRVRGTDMTPALQVTLVHELTHVAQDQYFDLSRISGTDVQVRSLALRSLAEGDADRIEHRYIDQLSPADRTAYNKQSQQDADNAHLEAVPPALVSYFGAPYALGDSLLGYLDMTGGNKAVNDAFQRPPATGEQLLDPFVFAVHRESDTPPAPVVARGDKSFDDVEIGSVDLYLMLASRLGVRPALQAADRIGGTSSVEFVHDGRTCVQVAVSGNLPGDNEALLPAFQAWANKLPAGAASAAATADGVSLRSCDPGEAATAGATITIPDGAFQSPEFRVGFAIGLSRAGMSASTARCVAGKIVDRHDTPELISWIENGPPPLVAEVTRYKTQCEADTAP